MALTKLQIMHRRFQGTKRLTRIWQVGLRARCPTRAVFACIRGTHDDWDVDYLLGRYLLFWGTPLKRETLMNIYRAENKDEFVRFGAPVREANTPPSKPWKVMRF